MHPCIDIIKSMRWDELNRERVWLEGLRSESWGSLTFRGQEEEADG